jgi:hypothetical protein
MRDAELSKSKLEVIEMKKLLTIVILVLALNWSSINLAVATSSHDGHGNMSTSGAETMAHGASGDTYMHKAVKDNVRAEFQIMSLKSMNMSDPKGNTHHIMVKFFNEGQNHQIKEVMGKIKVISPSGNEQVVSLKDYSGIYAANFTFEEKGKYGVICLFKVDGQKRLVKFWYPHG